MMKTTEHAVSTRRNGSCDGGHIAATCSCGWIGAWHPTRTVEGYRLAENQAADHKKAREATAVIESRMADSWLEEEVEAGRACGAHDRKMPCVECRA